MVRHGESVLWPIAGQWSQITIHTRPQRPGGLLAKNNAVKAIDVEPVAFFAFENEVTVQTCSVEIQLRFHLLPWHARLAGIAFDCAAKLDQVFHVFDALLKPAHLSSERLQGWFLQRWRHYP